MKKIILSTTDSEWFVKQLANPHQPNKRLKQALAAYKDSACKFTDNNLIAQQPKQRQSIS